LYKILKCACLTKLPEPIVSVDYLTTLSVLRLHHVASVGWWTNWKGSEKKRMRFYRGTIPEFVWRDWGIPQNPSQDSRCPGRDSNRAPLGHSGRSLSIKW
jgi:hypothetical protein